MSEYEVRQARISDWPELEKFINSNYGFAAPYKQWDRWSWQFLKNPFRLTDDEFPPVWIALKDGQIAGQIAVQAGRIYLDGEPRDVGWIVDVMVGPQHRRQGLGHRIHEAIISTGRTVLTLTMAEATRRIAEKAGCVTLAPVHQMVRIGSLSGRTVAHVLGPILRRRLRWRGLSARFTPSAVHISAVAAQVARGAAEVQRLLKAPADSQAYEVAESFENDWDIADVIFDRERETIRALCDRSAQFCRWRFEESPNLSYSRARLLRCGEPIGQVVWRLPLPVELPVGTIADILIDSSDLAGITALAAHAVNQMSSHTEAIVAGASHPNHRNALLSLGFVTLKKHRPTVVTRDRVLLSKIAELREHWHFTKADHDWDQVHPIS